ncbi:MAG: T9SS type A sorting domain-containing protein [Bacteroidota bacterium]|nr:T9SS type A sorting domain-containing protein [Bacteroidota bacterium]
MLRKLLLALPVVAATANLAHAQTGPTVQFQAGAVVTLPAGAGLAAIAAGDFNHDGRQDLAVCERNLNQVALYLRSAAGTYPTARHTFNVGLAPSGVVTFNRQPGIYRADLMALSGPSAQWTMLRDDGDTTGLLTRRVLTPAFGTGQPSPRPLLIQAQFNPSINAGFFYTYPSTLFSFINTAQYYNDTAAPGISNSGSFLTPYFDIANNRTTNLAVGDFDADGAIDVVLADSSYNRVHVISGQIYNNNYSFLTTERVSLLTTGRGPVSTSAADIDGDQLPDLAVAYAGSNEVMVLRTMTATFGFNRQYSYALPASPRRVLLADLNQDYRPELLVVTADNQLRVYQNSGSGTSYTYANTPPLVLATGVNPSLLQLADLDGDGRPDIIVGCAGDNTIHTYLNRSGSVSASHARQVLAGVQVFPTRATDHVRVQQATARPLALTLLDEVGRPVRQQALTQLTTTIATDDLPRGIYLLRLSAAEGTRTTRLVLE